MKKTVCILAVVSMALASCCNAPQCSTSLERAPEGTVNTENFGQLFYDVPFTGMVSSVQSLMVLKDGKVVYEQYDPSYDALRLHAMWSATKTFTGTAVGFAIQDGLMSLDDLVSDYFTPEELGEDPDGYFQKLTVKNLLIMSSGLRDLSRETISHTNPLPTCEHVLKGGWIYEPGSIFSYNSLNTHLLGVIVTKVTGKRLSDYLDEKLFTPLGIREWAWEQGADGYDYAGWGLFLGVESFAKMGQFYLQKGVWNGKRLLDEEWFDQAMSPQIYQFQDGIHEDDDCGVGYGFQMWCCTHGAYRLDGAWGQFCIIIPEKNAVVAIHEYTGNMPATLQSVWRNIYPAL